MYEPMMISLVNFAISTYYKELLIRIGFFWGNYLMAQVREMFREIDPFVIRNMYLLLTSKRL